jgi:Fur family transcriptional regulator, ferric uptake regulator
MTHHATRTLKEQGYRLTPQRTLVWDVLRQQDSHLSAEEICARVQESFPHVNLSTVYRTLELLVALNLVRESHFGPGRRLFEVEEEVPHHHLVCERCGSVTHVHDEELGSLHRSLGEAPKFSVREVTVFGTCVQCVAAAAESAAADAARDAGSPAPHAAGPPASE